MYENVKKLMGVIKSPKILVTAGIVGMVLICLSSFVGKGKSGKTAAASDKTAFNTEEYKNELEQSIAGIVKSITGGGSVNVVVTLESGLKYSYADINEGASANKTESNSESSSSELKQTYITVKTSDGGEQALLVTTQMPEVRGVAIVCEGGDDEALNEIITNAVTAALDIAHTRVYVAGGTYYEKR